MGVLFFREGRLLDARTGDQQGEPASLEIFSWDHISLSIQNDCQLQERRINRSMNALILEATQLKDEKAAGTIAPFSKTATDASQSSPAGGKENNEKGNNTHQRKLTEITDRLQNNSDLDGFIQNISHDHRWNGVLSQLMHVGTLLKTGELKAFSIITGSVSNYVIIPSKPPTVVTVHAKCPKEKLYHALE